MKNNTNKTTSISIEDIDSLLSEGYYLGGTNISVGDTLYIATLPHMDGSAALGVHIITNSKDEFDHFNAEANKSHYLYSVDIKVVL